MIEDMNCWTRGEENEPCRILTDVKGSDLSARECLLFMHVPYDEFRVSSTALNAYVATKASRLGIFLGRVDLSDTRHVVFGFLDEAARDALLAAEGVVQRKPPFPSA